MVYRKILVPLDGSDLAEAVLPHVEMLARARQRSHPAAGSSESRLPICDDRSFDRGRTRERYGGGESEKYLKRATEQLKAHGISVTSEIVEGSTAECILKVAEEKGADLIAMSTHGRSGVARWLIGSVADRVMRTAKVPVLLVRPAQQN